MNLYGLFVLDVNIKYIVFSILYRHGVQRVNDVKKSLEYVYMGSIIRIE